MGRAALTLALAIGWVVFAAAPPASAQPGPFDGHWSMTLICPASPDGAQPFRFDFAGDITGGVLHGEHGEAGQLGWMTLDGQVRPDGAANLSARGLTGRTAYNINQTERGVPYAHPVTAHFDGDVGSGQWQTTRTCNFTFHRQ